MEDVVFQFYIGDTYTRDITIEGYTDDIDEMFFTVKKNITDKRFVLQKTLDNGITLVDVVYEDDGTTIKQRTYNLLVDASDTEGMTPELEYSFDVEILTEKDDADPLKKTIITGTVVLTNAATRIYNESE